MGKLEIMMKQYEFLRKEIVQCIYLRQLAIVGIFTTIVAGLGALFSESISCLPCGSLQLAAVGVAFLVNCFGSLYVHEQHRNRRACHFNMMLERLMTKDAKSKIIYTPAARPVGPIIAWENFLMKSKACKQLNGPFYIARYLGVVLPILVFSVPLVIAVLLSFPSFGATLTDWQRVILLGLSLVSVAALISVAIIAAGRLRKSKDTKFHKTRLMTGILASLYLSPLVVALAYLMGAWSEGITGHCARTIVGTILGFESPHTLLLLLVILAIALGIWTLYICFSIMKWLGESTKGQAGAQAANGLNGGVLDALSRCSKRCWDWLWNPVPGPADQEEAVGEWVHEYLQKLGEDATLLKKWE